MQANAIGLVSPTQSSPGETIEASDINTPVNQLAAVINGSIETANLADSAVTTAKLADGAITPPKWTNPYKFRVSRNAAANTGNGAFAVVAFDTEQFDTNSNVAAGVYTVPVSGFYQFNWRACATTSGAQTLIAALHVNGTRTSDGTEVTLTTLPIGSNGSDLIQCAAGDTVDVRVFCNTARALNVGNITQNYFSGFLVSQT